MLKGSLVLMGLFASGMAVAQEVPINPDIFTWNPTTLRTPPATPGSTFDALVGTYLATDHDPKHTIELKMFTRRCSFASISDGPCKWGNEKVMTIVRDGATVLDIPASAIDADTFEKLTSIFYRN